MKHIKELNQEFKPGDMVAFAKGGQNDDNIFIGLIVKQYDEDNFTIKSDRGREIQRPMRKLINLEPFRLIYPELFI